MNFTKLTLIFVGMFFLFTLNVYGDTDLTLSRIYVEPGTLEPEFSETRNYYTLLLPPDTKNLVVQATPTNENLEYEIKGNENLKDGENIITITVYSQDKTKSNVYTINALKTNEPEKYNALLSTLIIDNYPFFEDFFPETFNYITKDNITVDMLDVFAYPQNNNATVEIKGNKDLKDGENTITVTVTSENKLVSRTYTITAYKGDLLINSNSTQKNGLDLNNKSEFKKFIITSIIIITTLILIIYFITKTNT